MRVNQVIETAEGKFVVQSTFTPQETAIVVEAGLRALIQRGQFPFERIGAEAERLFRAYPPSELIARRNAQGPSEGSALDHESTDSVREQRDSPTSVS